MKEQQAKSFREIAKLIMSIAAEATSDSERDECMLLALFYEKSAHELELRVKQRLH